MFERVLSTSHNIQEQELSFSLQDLIKSLTETNNLIGLNKIRKWHQRDI